MNQSFPLMLCTVTAVSSVFAYRYDPWYRADTQRPVDVITDVINELGVKILQQYSTCGNVAFSPTGVAFVLAALYEGSAGRGGQQIAEAIGLPVNRDVTRIGFRDIHRRLRVRSCAMWIFRWHREDPKDIFSDVFQIFFCTIFIMFHANPIW